MKTSKRSLFQTVKTEGGILPADLLQAISDRKRSLKGLTEESYHLSGIKLTEAIGQSWNRLSGSWKAFNAAVNELPEDDRATTQTREKFLLPLFQELGYGRLSTISKAEEIDGKTYSITHNWNNVPFVLVGCRVDIERRSYPIGTWKGSAHGLLQEYLNHCPEKLWGFVSNGYKLRILRDNLSLTRQAYVEFDIYAMFEGECYADFVILWLLCHESRLEAPLDAAQKPLPSQCWLEKWSQTSQDEGTRALEDLRKGVEEAINAIGGGFLAHPANKELLRQLRSGELDKQEYYRQILRIVYRLIFLFVVEDRDLIVPSDRSPEAKRRYYDFYSVSRLRDLAEKRAGSQHADQWRGLRLVFDKLGSREGCPQLGLPPLGSFLWSRDAIKSLADCELPNAHLLKAIYCLSFITQNSIRMSVDYRNLGSEELGSIYEALLEMHPILNIEAGSFLLNTAAGNERKTTGSYYTPTCLVNCLLDSALEPVIAERLGKAKKLASRLKGVAAPNLVAEAPRNEDLTVSGEETLTDWVLAAQKEVAKDTPVSYQLLAEKALLSLKICDPACGSGHFLIAAAHRTAKRLASVRTGDAEPSPEAIRKALRDVIGHCIYGVDINPMSVELCKVSLWVEALEPGKPLSFLDHHVKCGNSLIGATPEAIEAGIQDDAYSPIEGDEKAICSALKKQNKVELKQDKQSLFQPQLGMDSTPNIVSAFSKVDEIDDDSIQSIEKKQDAYEQMNKSEASSNARLVADLWCSAFVWEKTAAVAAGTPAPTTARLREAQVNPQAISVGVKTRIGRYAAQYKFFHWHLEFPSVFNGKKGGFDVLLGNPPWEHTELKEKEFFAERSPIIANAQTGAIRKRMIEELSTSDSALYHAYIQAVRQHDFISHFCGNSGIYPLCGVGRINLYAIFAELFRHIVSITGRFGAIFQSGIATDDTTKLFFQDLVETHSLVSMFDFENKEKLFQGAHAEQKFCLLTSGASGISESIAFVFFAHSIGDILNPDKRFTLSDSDFSLLNPNTKTCPIFRTKHDAELTKAIYRRVPVLLNEELKTKSKNLQWKIGFKQGLFNMATDSDLFHMREQLETSGFKINGNILAKNGEIFLPLYEGKLTSAYNNRAATFNNVGADDLLKGNPRDNMKDELTQADFLAIPRYWVAKQEVDNARNEQTQWQLSFHAIANPNNERSSIFTFLPNSGVGHSAFIVPNLDYKKACVFCASCNSFIYDNIVRQKLGSRNFSFFVIKQTPILSPASLSQIQTWLQNSFSAWCIPRVLELTYTAWDLEPFAKDCGYDGPPFKWDEERRFLLRAELDAAFFHLYLPADENGDWKQAKVSDGAVKDETPEEFAALKAAFPTPRDAVSYIMETFPIVKRKDEAAHGSYRTKDTILSIYDAMQLAIKTGVPYQTRLNPLPGPPVDANGNFIPFAKWDRNHMPSHIHPPKEESERERIHTAASAVLSFKRPNMSRPNYTRDEIYHYPSQVAFKILSQTGGSCDFDTFAKAFTALLYPGDAVECLKDGVPPSIKEWQNSYSCPTNITSAATVLNSLFHSGDLRLAPNDDGSIKIILPHPGKIDAKDLWTTFDAQIALEIAKLIDTGIATSEQDEFVENFELFKSLLAA